jgi:hypothetical protein
MKQEIPQPGPKPLKIHHLLALKTAWTEELWDEALAYLLAFVSTQGAILMTQLILLDDPVESPYKIDHLREFRPYPPSAVLAAFDLIRLNRL